MREEVRLNELIKENLETGDGKMTVQELMDTLRGFPGDMMVVTDGYEDGYEAIREPKVIEVKHMPENRYYDGEYQIAGIKDSCSIRAVAICRNRRAE